MLHSRNSNGRHRSALQQNNIKPGRQFTGRAHHLIEDMAGRPKSFDVDIALNAFVDVFWSKGYNATSIDDLQAVAGIKRGSFYAAFGGKKEVYRCVMDRYWADVAEIGLASLEDGETPIDGIAGFIRYVGAFMTENTARGCLLLSSAATTAPSQTDPTAVTSHMNRLKTRLTDNLKKDPTLATATPDHIEGICAYVLTILMGLNAMARTGHDTGAIRAAAEFAADTLQTKDVRS